MGVSLLVNLMYKWPDQYFVCLVDSKDNTSLFVSSKDRFFIYDAINGEILSQNGCGILSLKLGDDGEIKGEVGISQLGNKDIKFDYPNMVDIDISSIFTLLTDDVKLKEKRDNTEIIVAKSKRGNKMEAIILPNAKQPYKRIRFFSKNSQLPLLDIIRPKWKFSDDVPIFPWDRFLKSTLPISKLNGPTLFQVGRIMAKIFQTLLVRFAITTPSIRDEVSKKFGLKFDWNKITQKDKIIGKRLRTFMDGIK